MEKTKPNLEDLRREIDEIDSSLHDLIKRRAAIVELVAEAKGPQADSAMRSGREAEILRRLAANHSGPFSRGSVLRIWREMISSLTAMQGPYSIAVFGDDSDGLWDLARDHFGSHVELSRRASRREIVAGVADGTWTHGVLPYPEDGDERPWWAALWAADAPRVVLRLPFAEPGNVRDRDALALVIARVSPEESGDDRSLAVLEADSEIRRGAIPGLLAEAGLVGELVCAAGEGSNQYLVELAGFIAEGDVRLAELEKHANVERVRVIGAYPTPLAAAS